MAKFQRGESIQDLDSGEVGKISGVLETPEVPEKEPIYIIDFKNAKGATRPESRLRRPRRSGQ